MGEGNGEGEERWRREREDGGREGRWGRGDKEEGEEGIQGNQLEGGRSWGMRRGRGLP